MKTHGTKSALGINANVAIQQQLAFSQPEPNINDRTLADKPTLGKHSVAIVGISYEIALKSGTRSIKLSVTKKPITEKMTTVIRSGLSIAARMRDQPLSAGVAEHFKGKSDMTTPLCCGL